MKANKYRKIAPKLAQVDTQTTSCKRPYKFEQQEYHTCCMAIRQFNVQMDQINIFTPWYTSIHWMYIFTIVMQL
jgi:hypothetical protein